MPRSAIFEDTRFTLVQRKQKQQPHSGWDPKPLSCPSAPSPNLRKTRQRGKCHTTKVPTTPQKIANFATAEGPSAGLFQEGGEAVAGFHLRGLVRGGPAAAEGSVQQRDAHGGLERLVLLVLVLTRKSTPTRVDHKKGPVFVAISRK